MVNNADHEKNREDFVKEMYRVYWANMSRSMEGIWNVLAPLTVSGTILAGVHKDYLPASLGLSLTIVVILWAVNITIDLNAWHRRNLFFLTKAEQHFLREQDYGVLLPAEYKRPKSGWIEYYKINLITFFTFLLLVVMYAVTWKLHSSVSTWEWLLPTTVLLIGLALTWLNDRIQEKSSRSHFTELFQDHAESDN